MRTPTEINKDILTSAVKEVDEIVKPSSLGDFYDKVAEIYNRNIGGYTTLKSVCAATVKKRIKELAIPFTTTEGKRGRVAGSKNAPKAAPVIVAENLTHWLHVDASVDHTVESAPAPAVEAPVAQTAAA